MIIELWIAFWIGCVVWFAIGILVHRHIIKKEQQISILAFLLIAMWFWFHLYGFYVNHSIPWMVDILWGTAIGQILWLMPERLLSTINSYKKWE